MSTSSGRAWRTPRWWRKRNLKALLLWPLSLLWQFGSVLRPRLAGEPQHVSVPVICVGNAVAGGAGKTPVVLSLVRLLPRVGLLPHSLSRGYGGKAYARPHAVEPTDSAADVGDEALMLARVAPCWVSADRVASARDAAAHGAKVVVMDDGWQSPYLHKDLHMLVVDGAYGIGNGFCLPAGPLREPWEQALAKADAVVLLGEDATGLLERGVAQPVFRARLLPDADAIARWRDKQVLAFAGIGRPEKFFLTLTSIGAQIIDRQVFADHHQFSDAELEALLARAKAQNLQLLTTEKDWVRLRPEWRKQVQFLPVECVWENEKALTSWMAERLG
jgi:tetraacyldisaccharide 4'-kinase